MGRLRNEENRKLPKNLYSQKGYYVYRNPLTRESFGLGRDKVKAVLQANAANRRISANSLHQRMTEGLFTLLTAEEIVKAAMEREGMSGVYFLIQGTSIVYVGQSRNGTTRILQHYRERSKEFDKFHFVPCHPAILDELEATYIEAFKPVYNRMSYPKLARPKSIQAGENSDPIVSDW